MATAELAVAMPVLVIVLMSAVGLLHAVGAALRCQDAAGIAARAAARGDGPATIIADAQAAAPPGADVSVRRVGSTYQVSVVAQVGIPGPWAGSGPHWQVSGAASGPSEGSAGAPASGEAP
jgi:Flp pilus assembly protein TadG